MKDAYYFPHDSNAHNDPKIQKMLFKLKSDGYGAYWVIIEMLRNEPSLKLNIQDIDAIAYQSHSNRTTIAELINDFGLFTIDETGDFWSESLNRRVELYRIKSQKYTENANKRWAKNAIAMQSQCNRNALKERKGKERKGYIYTKGEKKLNFECVYLTDEERKRLDDKLGAEKAMLYGKRLNDYMMQFGKQNKYKSHYHTILAFSRKDGFDV